MKNKANHEYNGVIRCYSIIDEEVPPPKEV